MRVEDIKPGYVFGLEGVDDWYYKINEHEAICFNYPGGNTLDTRKLSFQCWNNKATVFGKLVGLTLENIKQVTVTKVEEQKVQENKVIRGV